MSFLQSIKLSGFLSFPPDAAAIDLTPLNVLIGPNGSGKSNLIEAVELLHAAPTAFAAAIRDGGTAAEWLWKGEPTADRVTLEVVIRGDQQIRDLRYRLAFAPVGLRLEIVEEVVEEAEKRRAQEKDVAFYYRLQHGQATLSVRDAATKARNGPKYTLKSLKRDDLVPDESVLSQRKGADAYPEVTWLAQRFARIQTFRDWSMGRAAPLRSPQKTDLPTDELLPNSDNLGLVLNELQHAKVSADFNRFMARFLPRYERFSTRIYGNAAQLYLHEAGLKTPVPATRLSDGTIRFMAILALLLSPTPPALLCIEEPELGLHPDAVGLLADLLVDASTRTQLIVTTHSDALISALTDEADSVLVCEYRGGTTLRRLEAAKLQDWLDEYRLGELWIQGKLGGNP